jgi:hypothetical protein
VFQSAVVFAASLKAFELNSSTREFVIACVRAGPAARSSTVSMKREALFGTKEPMAARSFRGRLAVGSVRGPVRVALIPGWNNGGSNKKNEATPKTEQ